MEWGENGLGELIHHNRQLFAKYAAEINIKVVREGLTSLSHHLSCWPKRFCGVF